MKRMSEVFELPVYVDVYGLNNANAETLIDGYDADSEHLKQAAHAINNCDALADALEEALLQIEYMHKKFGETGSGNSVLSRGSSALQAYRGAK